MTDLAQCPDCGTAVAIYKGSVHQWRCYACIDARIGLHRNVVHTTESLR